jgi:hypothetical protein
MIGIGTPNSTNKIDRISGSNSALQLGSQNYRVKSEEQMANVIYYPETIVS